MSTSSPARNVNADPEAVKHLTDAGYIAYVLVKMCRLGIGLLTKRWPEVG